MNRRSKFYLAVGATAAVAAAAGTGVAIAGGGDDDSTEVAIQGDALNQASEAALDYTGEGTVTGTEQGDEESYYEVEVTRDDGTQVDVQLDKSFEVVGSEDDDDTAEDE